MRNGIGLAIGAVAAAGLGSLFSDFIAGAREAAAVNRVIENAIVVTGGAANITGAQIGALTEKLSLQSGVDDDLIAKGASLILTFKNVRNEAGEGANVFDRATTAAVDLSAAGFGSVEGASIQLGKALNDPIAGIGALAKAGVGFTAQQKEQIKVLVESGNILGAQKIILAEVEAQVGGAAAAAADPMARLSSVGRILASTMEGPVLAGVDAFATFATTRLVPALQTTISNFQNSEGAAGRFRSGIETAFGVVQQFYGILVRRDFKGGPLSEDSPIIDGVFKIRDAVTTTAGVVRQLYGVLATGDFRGGPLEEDSSVVRGAFALRAAVGAVAGFIREQVWPALQGMAGFVQRNSDVIGPLVAILVGSIVTFKLVVGAVALFAAGLAILRGAIYAVYLGQGALNLVLTLNPIGLVIAAVAALVAIFVIAYKRSDEFREVVNKAWRGIQDAVRVAWEGYIRPAFGAISAFITDTLIPVVRRLWEDTIRPAFAGIGGAISSAWTNVIQPILAAWWSYMSNVLIPLIRGLWENVVRPIFDFIGTAIRSAWTNVIQPIFQLWWAYMSNVLIPIIRALWENVVRPIFDFIGGKVKDEWTNRIQPALSAFWSFIQNTLIPIIQFLWREVVSPLFTAIGTKIQDAWNNYINPALTGFKSIVDGVRSNVETADEKFDAFFGTLKAFKLPDWIQEMVDFVAKLSGDVGGGFLKFFKGIGDAPAGFTGTAIGKAGARSVKDSSAGFESIYSGGGGAGTALARVQKLLPGSGLSITSTYRSPAKNASIGGSPTSHHMDRANPAVDIAGPTHLMDKFAATLRANGPWRQLIWRAPGHYDHIHVAHEGGTVDRSWPTIPGLRADERPAILQVGEKVTPRGGGVGGGDIYITIDAREAEIRRQGRVWGRQVATELITQLDLDLAAATR